jgi:hypothetical protein
VPFTLARLLEDDWTYADKKKHCRDCGMWLYCFVRDGKRRWLNTMEREGETIYQDHDIWICDGRRGRRKPHASPA